MADPTLQLTFQSMQIRVADYLGIADRSGSVLAVPTDAKDLELVKRLVNDGYRRFITEQENWNFLNVPLSLQFVDEVDYTITARAATTLTVAALAGVYANSYFNGFEITATDVSTGVEYIYTVTGYAGATGIFTVAATSANLGNGDTLTVAGINNVAGRGYRYYMPDDFYGIWKQQFTFDENGPRVRIDIITEEQFRELRAGARTSGTAVYVAFRPINTTATSTGKRWEALFWPEPTGGELVSGVYKRFPAALSSNGDASVAGFHQDHVVLAAALAAAELFRNDKIGIHEQTYQQRLVTAKKLDARATPRKNRPFGDNSDGTGFSRPSSDVRPESYNNVPFSS